MPPVSWGKAHPKIGMRLTTDKDRIMTKHLDTPPPPKSPKHPSDDRMPPYTPGSVPPPEGELPKSDTEKTAPPNSYPPKQNP